ncbi:MAG: TonB-dependent receptor plug domain-containing protein [Bacteroidetes bacterium]|nr:TonB-dependent receptor plug domain-containing protein [Bacteroidota bacterium]
MKKILCLLVAFSASFVLKAQLTGEIKGKVLDSKTKEALVGVTVFVTNGEKLIADFTNINGDFTLKPLNPGTYLVTVRYTGYDTVKMVNVNVSADRATYVGNVNLEFGSRFLKTAVVNGNLIVDPENPSAIPITKKEIENMPDQSISGILRNTSLGVVVSDDGDEIYFRGSRNGESVFYVDGVKMRDNETHIPNGAIGNVVVYSGGVPAKYGDFTGGVVVIETNSYFSWLNEKRSREN